MKITGEVIDAIAELMIAEQATPIETSKVLLNSRFGRMCVEDLTEKAKISAKSGQHSLDISIKTAILFALATGIAIGERLEKSGANVN